MKKTLVVAGMCAALAGCGGVNNALLEKNKSVEYYRIFDIKTDSDRYTVAEAASDGLGKNVNSATEATPIPNFSEPPEKPGRFTLTNPFQGSQLAALAGATGSVGMKVATCDGAVWTAKAVRDISGQSNLNLTACLWQYQDGYHLDTYATFNKKEGGLMQISRDMASAMVGTPEEWTEKTILDIAKQIKEETGAKITYLEGYPKMADTPWVDELD
ncbi:MULTISPECIES: hypothetical protein [Salinivibrio]|uniref:Lipoprotein n=1 Tax=Salinivibrio siamensis TaxID=414286 RepID=A0ABX3K6P8_9GAMM|nr:MULTISPECIES: hypothetical protein [Salinivibrio]KKA44334.1 hypothetical protein WN56_11585 [Salinivibrio sp. KP-1]OOE80069.1 hypothetical protein BZG72_12960 [Salinivibrio sp. PR6]OOE83108.1 hypothetical protein BZG73_12360 [Salinivibrio siamensis]